LESLFLCRLGHFGSEELCVAVLMAEWIRK
jgi:hypothetical protein